MCFKWQKGINRGLWNICNYKKLIRQAYPGFLTFSVPDFYKTIASRQYRGKHSLDYTNFRNCEYSIVLVLPLDITEQTSFQKNGKLHLNFHPSVSFKHSSAYFSSLRKVLEVSSPCILTPTVTLIELWDKDKSLNFFLYHHSPIINFIWYVYLTAPH